MRFFIHIHTYTYSNVYKISYRCKQGKKLLLASLASWIIFTLPLGFIQPEAAKCIIMRNETNFVLESPRVHLSPSKRDTQAVLLLENNFDETNHESLGRDKRFNKI